MEWIDSVHWPTVFTSVAIMFAISIVLGLLARR